MTGYSDDLRERVIRSWQNGHTAVWIAAEYNIGFSTVKRYITRYKRLGDSRATDQKRQIGQFTSDQLVILAEQVRDHADATIDEPRDLWNERQVFQVSRATIGRAKKTFGAVERAETERMLFRDVASTLKVEKIKVVDESSTQQGRTPRYARSPRGQRAYAKSRRNYGKNMTCYRRCTWVGCKRPWLLKARPPLPSLRLMWS